jgi:preprotein translocase subunit SecA
MARQRALGDDPFYRVKLTETQWEELTKDYITGMSRDSICKKYNLNSVRYNEIRNYILSPKNREEGQKIAMEHAYTLSNLKAKSGAKRQGRNDICLCGSGKKYKFCCGK